MARECGSRKTHVVAAAILSASTSFVDGARREQVGNAHHAALRFEGGDCSSEAAATSRACAAATKAHRNVSFHAASSAAPQSRHLGARRCSASTSYCGLHFFRLARRCRTVGAQRASGAHNAVGLLSAAGLQGTIALGATGAALGRQSLGCFGTLDAEVELDVPRAKGCPSA
mmetsp:Transcript_51609/g.119948  ORF Transcript_51609/g.119948 Transcript_51609/m.119948 type:complete len:172 (-) Transcript_51609:172-687(-)